MSLASRDPFRLSYAPIVAIGGFGLAVLSQLRVQTFGREAILAKGEASNRFVVERIDRARRGAILSADGRQLAGEEDTSELVVDFRRVPNSAGFFSDLGAAADIPASELMQLRAAGVRSRTWPGRLAGEQAKRVLAVKAKWRADGLSASRFGERNYPLAEASAGIVGYLRDGKPKGGIEVAFDRALRGEDGRMVGMVDRAGEFLPLRMDPESRPRSDGQSIQLTLDSEVQLAAAAAVRQAVESNRADSGCAVVIEPATGKVLAMANWPSFDPNGSQAPVGSNQGFSDYNSAYMARLEPGSTFKILTLALALDEKAADMGQSINCPGAWKVWPTRDVHCDAHGGKRAHGRIGPIDAIAKSCNVSAAHWAVDIGYEAFTSFLEQSGLLAKPGLGLPGELAGGYNEKEYAKRLQLATFGFGQSLTVTPVALCSAFSALANGGVRRPVRLVERVGEREIPWAPESRLVSAEAAAKVMSAMEAVFSSEHGTGKSLRIPGYRLAGKTGTAEKRDDRTGTVGEGGYVSNFIGFVPAEQPKAAILVMVDHPKMGRYYGASVAGPAFQDIAKAVIRRYGIPRSKPSATTFEPTAISAGGPEVAISATRAQGVNRRP